MSRAATVSGARLSITTSTLCPCRLTSSICFAQLPMGVSRFCRFRHSVRLGEVLAPGAVRLVISTAEQERRRSQDREAALREFLDGPWGEATATPNGATGLC